MRRIIIVILFLVFSVIYIFISKQNVEIALEDDLVSIEDNLLFDSIIDYTYEIMPINELDEEYEKTIYLTFDDGPSKSVTPKLLDLLEEKGVNATFFVINKQEELDYLIIQASMQGNVVAAHSYTHNFYHIYKSEEIFMNDYYAISQKIKKLTNSSSNILRFAGGSSNTISNYNRGIMSRLTTKVLDLGIKYFDWNIDSKDTTNISSLQIYNNVIKHLSLDNMNVVLMHDYENNEKTIEAVSMIIDYGLSNGYKFDVLSYDTPSVIHKVKN